MRIKDRLEILYKERLEDAEFAKAEEAKRGYVRSTSGKTLSASDYRFLGVAEYVLFGNVNSFQSHLSDAAGCSLYVFQQFDAGKINYPFDGSEVSVAAYKDLLTGLASGDLEVSESLADRLGGRDEFDSRSNDFARLLCYALKYITLDQVAVAAAYTQRFAEVCGRQPYLEFQGYAEVMRGVVDSDLSLAAAGIERIATDHEKLARRASWFAGTEDELLSVWGIGIANLARRRGLPVSAAPAYIPADLLITAEAT